MENNGDSIFNKCTDLGYNIGMFPIEKFGENKFKAVRLLAYFLNFTVWIPFVFVGFIIMAMGTLYGIIKDI